MDKKLQTKIKIGFLISLLVFILGFISSVIFLALFK